MNLWKISFFNSQPTQVEAPDVNSALLAIQKDGPAKEIRSIICLSEAATTRAIFRARLSRVSDAAWESYRRTEQLLLHVNEKYPDETKKEVGRLLRCFKEAASVISEIYDHRPAE